MTLSEEDGETPNRSISSTRKAITRIMCVDV
jgi:hypothetical protein